MKKNLLPFHIIVLFGFLFSCSDPFSHKSMVTYDANGAGSGSVPVDANSYQVGATVTVLGNTGGLARTGYDYSGWNTNRDGTGARYSAGNTFVMGATNVILYVLWTQIGKKTYTVTYNPNEATGGSVPIDGNEYLQGATVTVMAPNTLIKSGSSFADWNTMENGLGSNYSSGATFIMGSADVTLYPVWIPNYLTFMSSGSSITITGHTSDPAGFLTIPGGVTSIGDQALYYCPDLTGVQIPANVTSIGQRAFQGCTKMTSAAIPDSVAFIGEYAFQACYALNDIALPPGLASISNSLFQECNSLAIVAIPSSVTDIGVRAFYKCTGMTSITIPNGVENISDDAFSQCTALTNIIIPASVLTMGARAFGYCTGLTNVVLSAGIPSIGGGSFIGCTALTSVTIPGSVESIGPSAFGSCTGLASVTMQATTPPSLPASSNAFANCAPALQIHVPLGTLAAYKSATGWNEYSPNLVSP